MPGENSEVVRRALLASQNSDLQALLSLIAEESRVYPRPEEPGVKESYEGHHGLFEYLGNWFSQWDEYETEPASFEDAPDDQVLVVIRERGHLKQSGITIDQDFSHSFQVKEGKIVEWRMYDSDEQAREHLGMT
jgi:ketosteroid isomerase-like protein